MIFDYFISYYFTADNTHGMGNINLQLPEPIENVEIIRMIEEQLNGIIKEDSGYEKVKTTIINYQLLRKEENKW